MTSIPNIPTTTSSSAATTRKAKTRVAAAMGELITAAKATYPKVITENGKKFRVEKSAAFGVTIMSPLD